MKLVEGREDTFARALSTVSRASSNMVHKWAELMERKFESGEEFNQALVSDAADTCGIDVMTDLDMVSVSILLSTFWLYGDRFSLLELRYHHDKTATMRSAV